MSDYLPPGCTDYDIEQRFGYLTDEEEDSLGAEDALDGEDEDEDE